MPIFDEYETVEQVSITEEPRHITTVWKARKSGPPDGRLYAVKCYAPRPGRITTGQPEDARQLDRSLTFLEGIKRLKRARTGGTSCVAAVHAFGSAPEGAWFVTDYCERGTLKEYIDLQGRVDSEALRQVVYSVITGCLAMKRSGGGKTHGNLKPSNMLLPGKSCPLRKTPLHLTDPHPAPRQLAALDTADQRTGGDAPDKEMEIQDLRAIGELILQLVEGRLLRNAYEYNYPVVRSEKWDELGKAEESWRGLCNRLLDPRLSLEKESLEKLEREYRPTVAGTNLLISLAVLGGIVWLGVASYFAVSALGKSVKVHRAKQEHKNLTPLKAGQSALERKNDAQAIQQAGVARGVQPNDVAATELRAEAPGQLDLAEKPKAEQQKNLTPLKAGQSALERKNDAQAIQQAGAARGVQPNDVTATELRAEAPGKLDLAEKPKAEQQKNLTPLKAGQSALERKNDAQAIQQAGVARGVQPNDVAATELRAEAPGQLDLAEKPKAEQQKNLTPLKAGQSALERKNDAQAIQQAGVARGVQPNDVAATELRADEEHYGSSHVTTTPGYDATRLSYIERASQLIGKKVYRKGSFVSVGMLEDVALDLSTGKLVVALVSSGSDQLATPVPPGSFTGASAKESVLGVDKKTFSSAPRVPKANWTGRIDASSLANMLRQFGQELSEATVSPARFSSGASLIGRHLMSQTGEPLGQLEDLMIDLPAGRLVFLVVKPVVGADPDKYLYALPPASVRLNTNGSTLVLKASLEHFVAGPHFPKEYWTELVSPELAATVYQHYAFAGGR